MYVPKSFFRKSNFFCDTIKLNRNCFPVKTETIKIFDMNKLGKSVNQQQSFDLWQAKKNIC